MAAAQVQTRRALGSRMALDALDDTAATAPDPLLLHALATAPDLLGGLDLSRYRRGVPMTEEVSLGLKSVIPFVVQLQVVFDDEVHV